MFNPFAVQPMTYEESVMDWERLYLEPYDREKVDPLTRCRILMLHCVELETILFDHGFHRRCSDNDLRRTLAVLRRAEQQQQKKIAWLTPPGESPLETAIGYELLAVNLLAALAGRETDPYVKSCFEFVLLEDADHLYRLANVLAAGEPEAVSKLTGGLFPVTPGRPSIAQHRHPRESVRRPVALSGASLSTALHILAALACEQGAMYFYMQAGPLATPEAARKLFQELAMLEEDHVSLFGSLFDPARSDLENLLLRDYLECYLYDSFLQDETDERLKQLWQFHRDQEAAHLHIIGGLLSKYGGKTPAELLPDGDFPEALRFGDAGAVFRGIAAGQVELTADLENFADVRQLPENHEFFLYQRLVNTRLEAVPSHAAVEALENATGSDFRLEREPNPVAELRDRVSDNTTAGRTRRQK